MFRYIHDAPDPLKTAGIVFAKILKSRSSDQLSIYSKSRSIQLRKAVGVRLKAKGTC